MVAVIADIHKAGKRCSKCRKQLPATAFSMVGSGKRAGHLVAQCKLCRVETQKQYKRSDPTIYDRVEWPAKLKRQYNITVDDYEHMLAMQNGGCAICGACTPGSRTKRFHVDHCHSTGRVRGLLCHLCNRMLGLSRDDTSILRAAAAYLERT